MVRRIEFPEIRFVFWLVALWWCKSNRFLKCFQLFDWLIFKFSSSAFCLHSLQQQRHGAPIQHEVQEQSASVRSAAGDAGRPPPAPPRQTLSVRVPGWHTAPHHNNKQQRWIVFSWLHFRTPRQPWEPRQSPYRFRGPDLRRVPLRLHSHPMSPCTTKNVWSHFYGCV